MRQMEPFGVMLDGDLAAHPFNQDNKRVDGHTGWADHGARWLAPEIGQWLSPDAPHTQPNAAALAQFWDLHPYQYARQNPTLFEDPDGNAVNLMAGLGFGAGGAAAAAGYYALNQALAGQSIDGRGMLAAATRGFVTGGLIGLSGGASLLTVRGATVLGNTAERTILAQETTLLDLGMDLASSGGKQRGAVGARSAASPGKKKRGGGKDNARKSTLPRMENGDFLPDPKAGNNPHSVLGERPSSSVDHKPYRQGATFGYNKEFLGRTDVSDHGRPSDHPNPHFHPAISANRVDDAAPPLSPETFTRRTN